MGIARIPKAPEAQKSSRNPPIRSDYAPFLLGKSAVIRKSGLFLPSNTPKSRITAKFLLSNGPKS